MFFSLFGNRQKQHEHAVAAKFVTDARRQIDWLKATMERLEPESSEYDRKRQEIAALESFLKTEQPQIAQTLPGINARKT